MNSKANNCIGCSVVSCAHHYQKDNYCTLDKINVTTHEPNPTQCECVDCSSFKARKCC